MQLEVCLEGVEQPAGHLIRDGGGATAFVYDPAYLSLADAFPISLSLPLREEPFGDLPARTFFGNLLQENDQLGQVVDRERLDRNDVVGLLFHLGSDCAGAISCLPLGAPPVKVPGIAAQDYDPLPPEEVDEIVDRLANRRALPAGVRDPSPVAGVRRKLSICVLEDGAFALPRDGLGVPTTHILKVPGLEHPAEARHEAAAARLARACGLDVAVPEHRTFGPHAALLIPRFDRTVGPGGVIRRIHQEDFAQALMLPPALKYERDGAGPDRFHAGAIARLLEGLVDPAAARESFLRATFFNLAIGNSDNHAKNHALLYDRGPVPRLAPLYDLVPIRLQPQYRHDFAFRLGNAIVTEDVTPADIEAFLLQFGLRGAGARNFISRDIAAMLRSLDAAAALPEPAFKNFDDMLGTQTALLSQTLGLGLRLRERDHFQARGGGWQSS